MYARERERQRESVRETERECVCVCEREIERDREREGVCVCAREIVRVRERDIFSTRVFQSGVTHGSGWPVEMAPGAGSRRTGLEQAAPGAKLLPETSGFTKLEHLALPHAGQPIDYSHVCMMALRYRGTSLIRNRPPP